jgi:hypothetical protein
VGNRAERELVIDAGDVRLAAGLVLPAPAAGPPRKHPAVLLLPGSGPVDRNSDHRRLRLGITRLLADHLADAGIASLRYDRRGVGASSGDFRSSGLTEALADARHALGHLAAAPEVDPARLAVLGHSEGALLAARLGAEQAAVRAVVLLACSARPGAEVLAWQARALTPTLPAPVRILLRLLRTDLVQRQRRTAQRLAATTTDVAWVGGARVNARWFREFMAWDPRDDLRRLHAPVLAVTGAKDLQVDPGDLAVVSALVPGEVSTEEVQDLNHILRHTPGPPSLSSYRRQVAQPLDPRVRTLVGSWLAEHLAGAPARSAEG